MADGALPRLGRKPAAPAKPAPAPQAPAEVPVYDPNKCAQLVGGLGLVQGKNVFHEHGGHGFIREAPKEHWYFLTPEQERNYSIQMAKQRQAMSPLSRRSAPPPAMPEKLVQIARENAQAAAAEAYSE